MFLNTDCSLIPSRLRRSGGAFLFLLGVLVLPATTLLGQVKGVRPVAETADGQRTGNTYAVVIGISDYQNPNISDLKYADRDAEAFVWFLQSPAGGKVNPENIRLLRNMEATQGNVAMELEWLLEQCNEGDQAIIYFSGHGDVEAKKVTQPGFLLCWDAPQSVYMGGGAFPLMFLDVIIATLSNDKKVHVLVIADACRAGKLAGSSIGGAQITATNLAAPKAQETRILSCQPNEFSLESLEWGHGRGVFSYHLINGLQGLADRSADGSVTVMEIERYLEDEVPEATKPHDQLPIVVGAKGAILSRVDTEQLAALKEKLQRDQSAGMAMIDSRSMEDMLMAGRDSATTSDYRNFKNALKEGHLLYPEEGAAYTLYQQISDKPMLAPFEGLMRRNLAAAFQNEAQQAINDYLSANPAELRKRWNYDKRYQYFPEYLGKAAEILGEDHFMYKDLKAREYYFTGLNLRLAGEKGENQEHFKSALAKQQEALQFNPNAPYAFNELGLLERRLGNYRSAVNYFEMAIARSPNWVLPWFNLCSVYSDDLNDLESAEHCGQQAVRIAPEFGPAHYNLAYVYDSMKDWPRAKASYQRAIQVDPDYSLVYFNLGLVYYQEKDFIAAELQFQHYIKRVPDDSYGYHNLGEVAIELGKQDEALAYFRKALEIDPTFSESQSSIAMLFLRRKQYDEAEKAIWKFHQLQPEDARTQFMLACAQAGKGNADKALSYLSEAFQKGFKSQDELEKAFWLEPLRNRTEYNELLNKYLPKN